MLVVKIGEYCNCYIIWGIGQVLSIEICKDGES